MRIENEYIAGLDSLVGLEERAMHRLPPMIFDWVAGGAGDEVTLRENSMAYRRYRLRPRVLTGIALGAATTEVEILSERLNAPIFIAPMGGQKIVHPEGDLATATAAREAGLGYMASAASSFPLEDIAEVCGSRWFQLYWQADEEITEDLIDRAEGAGYSALILTVDTPVLGLRRRDARNDFHRPADVPYANLGRYGRGDPGQRPVGRRASGTLIDTGRPLTWDDVHWLKEKSRLPLLLKGVLTAEDAVMARHAGVDGLVISNHGGRQLDHAPATLDVLPEIRAAVGEGYPLIVDGGIREASDVLIAVALGANAVGIGRPVLWALACGGPELLVSMLTAMTAELRRLLVQVGVGSFGGLTAQHVRLGPPVFSQLDGQN